MDFQDSSWENVQILNFTIFAFWNNCKSFHCQKFVISNNVLIAFSWLCSILLELDTGELCKISLHECEILDSSEERGKQNGKTLWTFIIQRQETLSEGQNWRIRLAFRIAQWPLEIKPELPVIQKISSFYQRNTNWI